MLKTEGVIKNLLCHSILFFKFRYLNKMQVDFCKTSEENDFYIVILLSTLI